jgi:DNA replication protein DnaC
MAAAALRDATYVRRYNKAAKPILWSYRNSARRADRLFARRLKQAGITQVNECSSFDWAFNPEIPRARLVDLATARFVRDHHGALLIGPPGVGKSHAAVAIAVEAIRAGAHRS